MNQSLKILALIGALLILAGCGRGRKSDDDQNNPGRSGINWGLVAAEFNPEVEETKLPLNGVRRIDLDLYGFDGDVLVTYVNDGAAAEGMVKGYTVWKNGYSGWQAPQSSMTEDTLEIKQYGTYACQIRIVDGQITELDGKCYVQLEVLLPAGAQIEVYNQGRLVSKRFFPMTTKSFLQTFEKASGVDSRFNLMDEYVKSYENLGQKPSLTASQLGSVVGGFSFREEKFKVLRNLQSYVVDRQNLVRMIDEKFSFWEREEALKICGITE